MSANSQVTEPGKAPLQPTAEQRDAIHIHDKNLIVVAGAGSGKTRVLVERYLQLLADNPDWRLGSLVAITFTREAAYEMRHRVRRELEKRADTERGGPWSRHLAEMDSARIDTIHGFCASILRANAAQAGIDPKFQVLDEVEAALLLESAIAEALPIVDPALLQLFAHVDANLIYDTLLRAELMNADLPDEPPTSDDLLSTWQAQWTQAVMDARDQLLAADEMAGLWDAADDAPDDALGDLYRFYADQLHELGATDDPERVKSLLRHWHKGGVVGSKGSPAKWGGKDGKRAAADQLRQIRAAVARQIDRIGDGLGELDLMCAQQLPLWLGLLRGVQRDYRQRKSESSLLDFDDLERLTERVLQDETVRQRYGKAEFKHVLVDEFQDTNRAQWRIARALANPRRAGAFFAVGDPKQSIYQFRGADVSVFNRVRGQIAGRGDGLELQLSTSFRSHQPLITQFNALFERILQRDDDVGLAEYEVAYEAPMTAFRAEAPGQPALECLLLDRRRHDPQPGESERYTAEEMRAWEAQEIARQIQLAIHGGRQVYDRELGGWRTLAYGDIALLYQSMSNVGLYEEAFKSLRMPFLTLAGRGYFDRQEVWDMLDLLRCLHNPLDSLSLASALRSPMFGFSDDLLLALRLAGAGEPGIGDPMPLWQALSRAQVSQAIGFAPGDEQLLRHAVETLSSLRRLAGRVAIVDLLRRALDETGYLAILTGLPDGARRRGNIEKLLDLAAASGQTSLGRFSRYLLDLSARELREGEATLEAGNAIKLMTVHASKGLEFPWVILPDASWTRGAGAPLTVLHDRELGFSCRVFDVGSNKYESGFAYRHHADLQKRKGAAERKRLLYVAATRAQDYLLISGQVSRRKSGRLSARGWLGQLIDALDLSDLQQEDERTLTFAGHDLRVMMPALPPSPGSIAAESLAEPEKRHRLISDIGPAPTDLPMLDAIQSEAAPSRHISASRIAEWIAEQMELPAAKPTPDALVPARTLGAIAHELLRYDLIEPEGKLLNDLAWQHGLRGRRQLDELQNRVRALLEAYRGSQVRRWIDAARAADRPHYAELPFIWRWRDHIIHGVIDRLLQREDGQWLIIDYKTTSREDDLARYARNYHPQLAVYAAAVQAQLKLPQPPRALIHFLPHNFSVTIEPGDLLAQIDRLEAIIADVEAHDA